MSNFPVKQEFDSNNINLEHRIKFFFFFIQFLKEHFISTDIFRIFIVYQKMKSELNWIQLKLELLVSQINSLMILTSLNANSSYILQSLYTRTNQSLCWLSLYWYLIYFILMTAFIDKHCIFKLSDTHLLLLFNAFWNHQKKFKFNGNFKYHCKKSSVRNIILRAFLYTTWVGF